MKWYNTKSGFLWKICFYIVRLKCLFYGCHEEYSSAWNMPDDWHSPTYCKRCFSCFDVYGIETTPYPVLFGSDYFLHRLSGYFSWEKP